MGPRLIHSMLKSALAALILFLGSQALAVDFTQIDVPGATNTEPFGINARGQIAGTYWTSRNVGHGFLREPNGTFQTIDFPGAAITYALGINDRGEVAGMYYKIVQSYGYERHAYVFDHGRFRTIEPPGTDVTFASGINARGQVVLDATGGPYLITHERYEVISALYDALGINDRGEIVGASLTGGYGVLQKDGSFRVINAPGAPENLTRPFGINARGDVAGWYWSGTDHGFFVTRDGTFTTFDAPNSTFTEATGINAHRDIVGMFYDTAGVEHGFLARF